MRGTVAALTALAAVASAAPAKRQDAPQVVGYWGSGGGSRALAEYCADDAGYDVIVMSFISQYGQGNIPSGGFTSGDSYCQINADGSGSGCEQVAADIQTCQAAGKKLILSLGGAEAPGTLSSDGDAEGVAYSLWQQFGNPATKDGTTPRPFGDVFVNGFDMDVERSDGKEYYPALLSKLRSYFSEDSANTYYLTSAPQCVLPEENLGPSLEQSQYDYIFIQFYNNNNNCDASNIISGGANGGTFNYDAWTDYLSGTPNSGAKIFVGIPGSTNGAAPESYVQPSDLGQVYDVIKGKPNFAGIMFWEAAESDTVSDGGCTFAQNVKSLFTSGSVC